MSTINDLKELFGEETYCVIEGWVRSNNESIVKGNLSFSEAQDLANFIYENEIMPYNMKQTQSLDLELPSFRRVGIKKER